ncbi:MAG: plasmid recombination protein [bacterium]|nr:plasmid recombination protein [bacterium]
MAHLMKYTRGAVHGILTHDERKKDETKEYKNKDIDKSKTHLNYSFIHDEKSAEERLKSRLNDLDVSKRSDVNVLASWVVTLPKEVKEKDQKKFFNYVNEFLTQKYGKDNIISSDVHFDETTPHIHFCFVPVVPNKKKNATKDYKVSAKELLNKTHLQQFHDDLNYYISNKLGYESGILNGATTQNKSIKEMKREEINKLSRIIEKEPEIKKGIFSKNETVKIPVDEYEILKKKTQDYINSQNAKFLNDLLAENERLKKEKAKIRDDAQNAINEAQAKADKAIAEAQEKATAQIEAAKAATEHEIMEMKACIRVYDDVYPKAKARIKRLENENATMKQMIQSRGRGR